MSRRRHRRNPFHLRLEVPMPWQAIMYVSSGLTLAAFLAATFAYIWSLSLRREKELIESAPPEHRGPLVQDALERFHINTDSLTGPAKVELALKQLESRNQRFAI